MSFFYSKLQHTNLRISKTALAESCLASCLLPAVASRSIELSLHLNVNEGACDGPHDEMQVNKGCEEMKIL
jgi:hypothetical protein